MDNQKIFSPLKIGSLETKNRIFRSATCENTAQEDGSPTEAHLDIYQKLAEGECGLIITGISYVSEDSKMVYGQNGIYKDELVEKWEKITEAVHELNGKIIMQVGHVQRGFFPLSRKCIAPSPVPFKHNGFVPREMTEKEIEETIKDFKKAILRAQKAGFDGVQLQMAHGFLLGQFLSPYANKRMDIWGGSLENRLRITTRIIREVKDKLPLNYPIMVKINSTDLIEGGITPQESAKAVKMLSRNVSAFELSAGLENTHKNYRCLDPAANECYLQEEFKYIREDNPNVILGANGGIRSLEKIQELINMGFDFVSLSRPLIRDPYLVKKFREKKQEKSECNSCSLCIVQIVNSTKNRFLKKEDSEDENNFTLECKGKS